MNPVAILAALPSLLKTIGKITGITKVTEAGDALGATQLPPEKQAELEMALAAHAVELAKVSAGELATIVSESNAATASEDAFVRRARPAGLYVAYAITTALAVAMIAKIPLDTGAIATLILPLFGNAMWYTHSRTSEKLQGKH
jgi:hypothetical protein